MAIQRFDLMFTEHILLQSSVTTQRLEANYSHILANSIRAFIIFRCGIDFPVNQSLARCSLTPTAPAIMTGPLQ
jgi:hypothetical protein